MELLLAELLGAVTAFTRGKSLLLLNFLNGFFLRGGGRHFFLSHFWSPFLLDLSEFQIRNLYRCTEYRRGSKRYTLSERYVYLPVQFLRSQLLNNPLQRREL